MEDARIFAAENGPQEGTRKLDGILTDHQSELSNPSFAEIYWAIQRDRGFRLTDLGSFKEALQTLEEVDSADPHDRWTLFYLGYCYHCTDKYAQAQEKLEEAVSLHLTPDFEGQAHCLLGVGHYKLGDYANAKLEFEEGVKTAPIGYIRETGIWRCACVWASASGLRPSAMESSLDLHRLQLVSSGFKSHLTAQLPVNSQIVHVGTCSKLPRSWLARS